VKLRSAPLDDVFDELVHVLTDRHEQLAGAILFLARCAYRYFHAALLAALRFSNRRFR